MSLVMWDVTEFIASLAENIIIIDFYSKFHGMKYSGVKNILMSVFIVFFLTLFSMLTENYTYFSGMTALISAGIIIVYGIIFLEGKLFTKVLVPLLLFFVIFVINVLLGLALSRAFQRSQTEIYFVQDYVRFLGIVLSKLIFYALIRFTGFKLRKEFQLSRSEWGMIIYVSFSLLLINTFMIEYFVNNGIDFNEINAVILVLSAGIIVFMLTMLPVFSERNKENAMIKFMDMKIETQKKQIDEVVTVQKKMQIISHDINNHLICIQKMIDDKKYGDARDYIAKLTSVSLFSSYSIPSYDAAVQAVLTAKYEVCMSKGIEFIIKTDNHVPEIENTDICILLSNLIDNAIEACAETDKPEITLNMSGQNNYYCILIENTVKYEVLKNNPHLFTTKNDKSVHGIGTKSISEIINKYHGMSEYYEESGKFAVNIMLLDGIKWNTDVSV